MNNFISNIGIGSTPSLIHVYWPFLVIIALWTIFWKGLALWHAGKRGQVWPFIILLVVNTVGILEIIYLFAFLKLKFSQLFNK